MSMKQEAHQPCKQRYERMTYNRCGRSGLLLPAISLGLWNNFGGVDDFDNMREMVRTAFDCGITHFDLANNYGPPPGSAESNFGRILKKDFRPYRDEMILSTKAGFTMWEGPYGDWGSKKYLTASLDQSLARMRVDYVDIFYHHRPDPNTPIEETMDALAALVRQGKALYVGISNYNAGQARQAISVLRRMGVHCLIHQPNYSMFDRWSEEALIDTLKEEGVGMIAFCPLAQGLLTNKYLRGIPADSRAASPAIWLRPENVTADKVERASRLNDIAAARGQSLAQMALAWVLRHPTVTSALTGASKPAQILENARALEAGPLTPEELERIDEVLAQ